MAWVSRKEAAAECGFSRQRLEKLIKQGRIVETADGVDIEQARRVRAEMLDRRLAMGLPAEPPQEVATAAPAAEAEPAARRRYNVKRGEAKVSDSGDDDEDGDLLSYHDERTKREKTRRLREELAYRRDVGQLIPVDEVKAREFEIARKLRDRILGWPARVQNFLPPDAMKIMIEECEALVREMQEEAARIAERRE